MTNPATGQTVTGDRGPFEEAAQRSLSFFRQLEGNTYLFYKAAALRNISAYQDVLGAVVRRLKAVGGGGKWLIRLIADLDRIGAELSALRISLKEPFHLFLIGLTKAGKSTLVNALLGQDLAEVNVAPCTWRIDVYKYAPGQQWVELRWQDGRFERVTRKQAIDACAREESARRKSEQEIRKMLMDRWDDLTPDRREAYRQSLVDKHLYRTTMTEIHWPYEEKAAISDFLVVDTPGVFQALATGVEIGIQNYLHKADGVIWVLDATGLPGAGNAKMAEEIDTWLGAFGGKPRAMIAVLNRFDLLLERDPTAGDKTLDRARKTFGDRFDEILSVCGTDACEGQRTGDRKRYERSNIPTLVDLVQKTYRTRAARIQGENKTIGLQSQLELARKTLLEYWDKVKGDSADYTKRASDLDGEFSVIQTECLERLANTIDTHAARWHKLVEARAKDILSITGASDDVRQQNVARFVGSEIISASELDKEIEALRSALQEQLVAGQARWRRKAYFEEYKGIDFLSDKRRNLPVLFTPIEGPSISVAPFEGGAIPGGLAAAGALFVLLVGILGPLALIIAPLGGGWLAWKLAGSKVKSALHDAASSFAVQVKEEHTKRLRTVVDSYRLVLLRALDESFSSLYLPPDQRTDHVREIEAMAKALRFVPKRGGIADMLFKSEELT